MAALLAGLITLGAPRAHATPNADETQPPFLGVDQQDFEADTTEDQTVLLLNHSRIIGQAQFADTDSWALLTSPTNAVTDSKQWLIDHPGSNLQISLPMLSSDTSSTPTMQQGAAGAYDSYYVTMAQTLVNNGMGSTIIRIGRRV